MTVPCARYYEEGEYERKVRKRRARLLTTAEESFTHIKRMRQEHTGKHSPQPSLEDLFTNSAGLISLPKDS